MKKYFLLLLCFLLLLATWATLFAQSVVSVRPRGTVLILDNGRIMEGDIEKIGNKYRIRRQIGELWISASRAKILCKDRNGALEVMRSRANLRDPDERLRLARWCHQNEMFSQAMKEAGQALEMRPDHEPTKYFLGMLKRTAKIANRPPSPVAKPKELPSIPSLDLGPESLKLFTTKVQPILMNTCATCHMGGKGGDFQLRRTFGRGSGARGTTLYNLDGVIRQVNLQRTSLSPLLYKSLSAHGNAPKPPLPSRQSAPYQTLKKWIELTVENNPHLQELQLATNQKARPVIHQVSFNQKQNGTPQTNEETRFADPKKAGPVFNTQRVKPRKVERLGSETVPPVVRSIPATKQQFSPPPEKEKSRKTFRDEFDPEIFNQQMHSPGDQ